MSATIIRPMPGATIRTGLPFKPYVYRGIGTDTLTPELNTDDLFEAGMMPCLCGETMYGYRKHLADGEEPCQGSRDAVNAYSRERARQRALGKCGKCGYSVTGLNHRTLCAATS